MILKIQTILESYHSDKTRLIDMLWDIHRLYGYLPPEAIRALATGLNMSEHDVRETSTFYHFFHHQPAGKHKIYLSSTVIAKMNGYQDVLDALIKETSANINSVSDNGTFGLYETSCIGLSDQEPAMMIDDVVFTRLTPNKISDIITRLKQGQSPEKIANPQRLANNTLAYVENLVESNIRQSGSVFFKQQNDYRAMLERCIALTPTDVITATSTSKLRGRGGAGFSAGLKWKLCREAPGATKYVICNADEGEPGTFKDRVLLTKSPKQVFLGMVAAAYAIGSKEGIIYLRAEYIFLKKYLEHQLQQLRDDKLLGDNILGRDDFSFDIRIQMGAGAYICGDESALIESCEGKRGTPRIKPPFPVQQGYLNMPTSVNNVETFAAVYNILDNGALWYEAMGTKDSTGTRLLSISGDCEKAGIYEIEWGTTLNQVLAQIGADDPWAVQVSGPSGECLSVAKDGNRQFCYSDLSCNGSLMVFNRQRDLLDIVKDFMAFFVDESCGICTPCRAGNVDLHHKIERVIAGRATQQDLDDMISWGNIVRHTSRCGLGATSPKPILTTLNKFPELYQQKLVVQQGPLLPSFDMAAALSTYKIAHIELVGEEN
jgi:[NiFe] hydrogenase diaphorase moiety large subunit